MSNIFSRNVVFHIDFSYVTLKYIVRVDVLDGMEDKRLNQDISDYTTFYTRENTKAFNLWIKTSKDSYS